MKTIGFIIFFAIAICIYGLGNYYIFIRGWQAIPKGSPIRHWFAVVFILLASSFILGRTLERLYVCCVSDGLIWLGSFWLAFMLYFFIAILFLDLLRLGDALFKIFPQFIKNNYTDVKIISAISITAIVSLVILLGWINASIPRVKTIRIEIPKRESRLDSLRIVMASDIHLGTIVSNSRLETLIEKMNSLEPDIILLVGDILDEDIKPVIDRNHGEILKKLRTKYGIYAVPGNHEFIGDIRKSAKYLEEHGIIVLRDSVLEIDDGFYLIGREDISGARFNGTKRKSLDELKQKIDIDLPTILMDHQPVALDESERAGVDLHLSGHTHHAQLWPLNFITKAMYKISWGYEKFGGTHFYVSSGYGTWGPPVRIGNTPEIVVFEVKFD